MGAVKQPAPSLQLGWSLRGTRVPPWHNTHGKCLLGDSLVAPLSLYLN